MPKVMVGRRPAGSRTVLRILAVTETLSLCLSVTMGIAALFPGSTEWAFQRAPEFLRDPKSCWDFGWPLFALGGGLALVAAVAGWVASLRAATIWARAWLVMPLVALAAWLLAWTYSQPCGVSNP